MNFKVHGEWEGKFGIWSIVALRQTYPRNIALNCNSSIFIGSGVKAIITAFGTLEAQIQVRLVPGDVARAALAAGPVCTCARLILRILKRWGLGPAIVARSSQIFAVQAVVPVSYLAIAVVWGWSEQIRVHWIPVVSRGQSIVILADYRENVFDVVIGGAGARPLSLLV